MRMVRDVVRSSAVSSDVKLTRDIPEPTIRRRFEAGRRLLVEVYQPLVDQWVVYDNAGEVPVLLDWRNKQ